jgi:hypothetical protein
MQLGGNYLHQEKRRIFFLLVEDYKVIFQCKSKLKLHPQTALSWNCKDDHYIL